MSILLVATKRYKGQRIQPWWQSATQTNRDPNRDKALARSNHPRTSETYRRQDDVFGYELQFLLSEVLPVFQDLSELRHKLQRRLFGVLLIHQTKSSRVIQKVLPATTGGLHKDKLCDTLHVKHRPISNICIPPRATPIDLDCCRLTTASVLGNKNRQITLHQTVLISKAKFL